MNRAVLLERLKAAKPWLTSQGVMRLRVFGSHARDEAGPESDVDLIIEFEPAKIPDLFTFSGIRLELEKRLGAPVDLVTPASLHPALKARIEASLIDA